MVDSEAFQEACDFAILEYAARLATHTEPAMASVMAFKLQGAHEFMQTLRNLSETLSIPDRVAPISALNHQQH